MCDGIMIIMFLCIFDCYECCALLERLTICAFCRAMRHALVNTKSIRMHRLHRAASLVAEVECAFIGPLRSAFDASVKTERLPIGINNLEAS